MTRFLRRQLTVRGIVDLTVLASMLMMTWFMWPTSLGGSTQFIVVQGESMEPTYHTGDLIVVNTTADFVTGDIVVFQIPDGQPAAGHLIIHRVIGVKPDGTLVTQGDNRDTADSFTIRRSDVLGTPRLVLPQFGRAVGFLSSPAALGAAAGLASMLVLWPRPKPRHVPELVGLTIDDDGWSSLAINAQAKAEAEVWLRTQLERVAA